MVQETCHIEGIFKKELKEGTELHVADRNNCTLTLALGGWGRDELPLFTISPEAHGW